MQLSLHAGVLPKKCLCTKANTDNAMHASVTEVESDVKQHKQHQVNGSTKAAGKPSVSKQKEGE